MSRGSTRLRIGACGSSAGVSRRLRSDWTRRSRAGRAGRFGLVIGVARKGNADALRESGADLVVDDLAELVG